MRGTRACAAYCVERATLRVLRVVVCSVQRTQSSVCIVLCMCVFAIHSTRQNANVGPVVRRRLVLSHANFDDVRTSGPRTIQTLRPSDNL